MKLRIFRFSEKRKGSWGLNDFGLGEHKMRKSVVALLTVFVLHTSVQAADKVRISIPNLSGQFMTMSLAHKRGFLKEEGIDAEIIRVTGATNATSEPMKASAPIVVRCLWRPS